MNQNFVSNSQESTRMFKSNFLENLSKVHFSVPLFIYVPVIVFLSWKAMVSHHITVLNFILYFLFGIFIWTITEYLLHRFVFHYELKSKIGSRIHFIFHGVHHDYPNDRLRLVMPPSVSIPLATLFFFLFRAVFHVPVMYAVFPGFLAGYLFYDISHYAIHHFTFNNKFWNQMKVHHMRHHYADPTRGFGVSSSIWDVIFRSGFLKK